jgi:tRNA threonylcarbamoyladenosine biosynthesis protein TsaE
MPILAPNSFEIISRSPDQTRRIGMRLGGLLQQGDIIGLSGDLGAGKTTLMQGIAAGWGSLDPVTSPTFVLVNVYRQIDRFKLFHLDAYRLSGASEAVDLDLDFLLEQGSLVVEWVERIRPALPKDLIWIKMKWIDDEHRDLLLVAEGERSKTLLTALRKELYGG